MVGDGVWQLPREPGEPTRSELTTLLAHLVGQQALENDDDLVLALVDVQWWPACVHDSFEQRSPAQRIRGL